MRNGAGGQRQARRRWVQSGCGAAQVPDAAAAEAALLFFAFFAFGVFPVLAAVLPDTPAGALADVAAEAAGCFFSHFQRFAPDAATGAAAGVPP